MKEITGCTKLTGLLGSPVAHSISPQMHNEAFQQLNLDYAYLAFDVKADSLEKAVDGLRTLGVQGFNLTMPHKTAMVELCDKLSPAAKLTGAVNTVLNENGILTGYTTDSVGYFRALKEEGHSLIGKKMTLLGTGGAATAILVQGALDGVSEISVFNRKGASYERAERLIETLKDSSSCKIKLYDIADKALLKKEIMESKLLTNGTSVGMAPNTHDSIITDISLLHKDLIVSDVIYNPRETAFLKLAKELGCTTYNGLGMLLYQGAEAFRIWTGHEMPVDIIKQKYFSE